MSGEIMVQKPLDQSGCTMSYKRFLRYEVEFLYVIRHLYYRSNKFTFSFQLGVVRHDWALSKLCQIMSQLYLNIELSCKAGFLHVVRDPSKLQIYLIISSECDWSGMPKVIQNNESAISQKWALVWRWFFCMCLGIHKNIFLIQFIRVGVVRHTWAYQK